jgi:thioester reductase-like protein
MATFLTGATGYLGSYLAAGLLAKGEPLNVLVRAKSEDDAKRRLWKSMQLHLDFDEFEDHLHRRVQVFVGDLSAPSLGLDADTYQRLVQSTNSVLHCAASLNRTSERSCMNVNLKGTLAVVQLARAAQEDHGLRRFSQVSTVSVAGERSHEVVTEDEAVDWHRRDYDAYGRTKKFAEHLVRSLLPDVPKTIFRPAIVMGDSRFAETTQFDMVRAFSILASLPFLPLRPLDRIDIVPANWVARCIVTLHLRETTRWDTYHLSAGTGARTYREITDHLTASAGRRAPLYLPGLERPFGALVSLVGRLGRGAVRGGARLIEVFLPYLTYDTVFDNSRAVEEVGAEPAPFTAYCVPLLEFSRRHGFRYPAREWPTSTEEGARRRAGSPETLEDLAGSAVSTNGHSHERKASR